MPVPGDWSPIDVAMDGMFCSAGGMATDGYFCSAAPIPGTGQGGRITEPVVGRDEQDRRDIQDILGILMSGEFD